MNLIYLTGYMGSGKSTIGQELARVKDWRFIDLDDLITKRIGHSVPVIFDRYGEDVFRAVETSALNSTFAMSNVIVATGGGAPCFFDNINQMKKHGTVFYLNLEPDVILQRVKSDTTVRPILFDKKDDEILRFIREHLNLRTKYYSQADFTLQANKSIKDIVADIIDYLKKETTQ